MASLGHRMAAAVAGRPLLTLLVGLTAVSALTLPAALVPPGPSSVTERTGLPAQQVLDDALARFGDAMPIEVELTVLGRDVVSLRGLATVRAIEDALRGQLPSTWLRDRPGEPAVEHWLTAAEQRLAQQGRSDLTPGAAELDDLVESVRTQLPIAVRDRLDAYVDGADPTDAGRGTVLVRLDRAAVTDDVAGGRTSIEVERVARQTVAEALRDLTVPYDVRAITMLGPDDGTDVPLWLAVALAAALAAAVARGVTTRIGTTTTQTRRVGALADGTIVGVCVSAAVAATTGVVVVLGPSGWRLTSSGAAGLLPLTVAATVAAVVATAWSSWAHGEVDRNASRRFAAASAADVTTVAVSVSTVTLVAGLPLVLLARPSVAAVTAETVTAVVLGSLVPVTIGAALWQLAPARSADTVPPPAVGPPVARRRAAGLLVAAGLVTAGVAVVAGPTPTLPPETDAPVTVLVEGELDARVLQGLIDAERALAGTVGARVEGVRLPLLTALDLATRGPSLADGESVPVALPGERSGLLDAGTQARDLGLTLGGTVPPRADVETMLRDLVSASPVAARSVRLGDGADTARISVTGVDAESARTTVARALADAGAPGVIVRASSVDLAVRAAAASLTGLQTAATVASLLLAWFLTARPHRRRQGAVTAIGASIALVTIGAAAMARTLGVTVSAAAAALPVAAAVTAATVTGVSLRRPVHAQAPVLAASAVGAVTAGTAAALSASTALMVLAVAVGVSAIAALLVPSFVHDGPTEARDAAEPEPPSAEPEPPPQAESPAVPLPPVTTRTDPPPAPAPPAAPSTPTPVPAVTTVTSATDVLAAADEALSGTGDALAAAEAALLAATRAGGPTALPGPQRRPPRATPRPTPRPSRDRRPDVREPDLLEQATRLIEESQTAMSRIDALLAAATPAPPPPTASDDPPHHRTQRVRVERPRPTPPEREQDVLRSTPRTEVRSVRRPDRPRPAAPPQEQPPRHFPAGGRAGAPWQPSGRRGTTGDDQPPRTVPPDEPDRTTRRRQPPPSGRRIRLGAGHDGTAPRRIRVSIADHDTTPDTEDRP